MFFQNAFGGGGGMGGSSPSAFTSPGMNPQALAQLMAMQGSRGPSFPQLQRGAGQNAAPPPQMPGAVMAPQQQAPQGQPDLSRLMQMLQSNGGLSGLFGSLFGQQPGMPTSLLGGMMPGMPGPGTGGLY